MAKADFILQAVTATNHASAVVDLLQLTAPNRVLASVAYLREAGLEAVEDAIRPLAEHTEVFVGIRNDLTSIQAVKRLLGLNVSLYAVDTASRQTIYHPKLYLSSNDAIARVIIGSANLTFGGMYNNIEISAVIALDLTDESDKKFVDEINAAFANLLKDHTDHVFRIRDAAHADALFDQGRLADENVIPPPNTGSTVKKGLRDSLRPMKLNLRMKPKPNIAIGPPPAPPPPGGRVGGVAVGPPRAGPAVSHRVWQSNGLTERDLNVPSGSGTHKTGAMGWKKGAWENIDHRHYFRDDVFKTLAWTPKDASHERATARFELLIKGLNYGTFELELGHDTRTNTKSYKQNNMMTDIKWGAATKYIAKRDLLGRTLYLYSKDTIPPEFVIEID